MRTERGVQLHGGTDIGEPAEVSEGQALLRYTCGGCQATLEVDAAAVPPEGAIVACPNCATEISIPPRSEAVAETSALPQGKSADDAAPRHAFEAPAAETAIDEFESFEDELAASFRDDDAPGAPPPMPRPESPPLLADTLLEPPLDDDDFEIPDEPQAKPSAPVEAPATPAVVPEIDPRDLDFSLDGYDGSTESLTDGSKTEVGKEPLATPAPAAPAAPDDPFQLDLSDRSTESHESTAVASSGLTTDDNLLGESLGLDLADATTADRAPGIQAPSELPGLAADGVAEGGVPSSPPASVEPAPAAAPAATEAKPVTPPRNETKKERKEREKREKKAKAEAAAAAKEAAKKAAKEAKEKKKAPAQKATPSTLAPTPAHAKTAMSVKGAAPAKSTLRKPSSNRKQLAAGGAVVALAAVLVFVDPFGLKLFGDDDDDAGPRNGRGGASRSGGRGTARLPGNPEKSLAEARAAIRSDVFGKYMEAYGRLQILARLKAKAPEKASRGDDGQRTPEEEAEQKMLAEIPPKAKVQLLKLQSLVLIGHGPQDGARIITETSTEALVNELEKTGVRDAEYNKAKAAWFIVKRNFGTARENLDRADAARKRDAEVAFLRGLSYVEQVRGGNDSDPRDRAAAESALTEALTLDATYGAAHYQLGRLVLATIGHSTAPAKSLQPSAISLQPGTARRSPSSSGATLDAGPSQPKAEDQRPKTPPPAPASAPASAPAPAPASAPAPKTAPATASAPAAASSAPLRLGARPESDSRAPENDREDCAKHATELRKSSWCRGSAAQAQSRKDPAAPPALVAQKHFRAALQANPIHAPSYLALGKSVHLDLLKDKVGARYYLNLLVAPESALIAMASADELAQAYVVLGRLARDDGDATQAIKWLEAGLAKSQRPALKSELLTELGGLELKRRDWKAAIARFEAAIKASPVDIDAHTGLGSAELGAGSPLRARKSSETARRFLDVEKLNKNRSAAEVERTHERTARLMSLRGRIFAHPEVNETADSVEAFRVAIEASRRIASEKAREIQAEVYVNYIQGLLARKSFNDALAVLKDAQKVIPDAPAVTAGFGDVYFEQKEYRAAEDAYKKTIAKAPNFVSAHFNLARVYGQTGRAGLAQKALDLVQKLDPHYPGLRLELALNFRQQKRLADALNQFNLAIKENPNDPFLLIQIARANFDAGGRDALLDARRYLDQVIQQNPGIIEARYWRGRTLIALNMAGGEPNAQRLLFEAQDDLRAVTEKITMNGVYRLWYAKTFDFLGNGADALYHYEEAAKLLTRDRNEVDIIEAQYRAARIRFSREELPAAKVLLDAIWKRTRTHRGALLLLGDYYVSSNQPAKAIVMYGRAIAQKGGGNLEAHKKRAQAYMQVNLPQSALADFRTVARLDPTDPEPHMMLGRAAKIAGQTALAIREFEAFLKLHQAKAARGPRVDPYAKPTVDQARQAKILRALAKEVEDEIFRLKNPVR